MAKPSYAAEMYNRIDKFIKEETQDSPKSSGLLTRSNKNNTATENKEPINIVANAVAAIRKKKEMIT